MPISTVTRDSRATAAWFADEKLCLRLADGREVAVPLAWFPSLLAATPAQRANWRFVGPGVGLHWEELDEDLSVAGLLAV